MILGVGRVAAIGRTETRWAKSALSIKGLLIGHPVVWADSAISCDAICHELLCTAYVLFLFVDLADTALQEHILTHGHLWLRHWLAQVKRRRLTLDILQLKALFQLLAHLLINWVDWGEGVGARVRCILAPILTCPSWLWLDFANCNATVANLELFGVDVFNLARSIGWRISIVMTLLLLVCLELLALVAATDDFAFVVRTPGHGRCLPEGRWLGSTIDTLLFKVLRFRFTIWRLVCRLFHDRWIDEIILACLHYKPQWRWLWLCQVLSRINNLQILTHVVLECEVCRGLSQPPFLFLHFSGNLLKFNGSERIWNCLHLEWMENVLVCRYFYAELLLLRLYTILTGLRVVLRLDVLLH